MKAIIKSMLVLYFLIFSTSSFSAEARCNCTCRLVFHEEVVHSFPAVGDSVQAQKKYCEDNNEEDCSLVEDGERYEGELEGCKRSVDQKEIKETKDTLNQLGIEMK
jgi:hypothetical protein